MTQDIDELAQMIANACKRQEDFGFLKFEALLLFSVGVTAYRNGENVSGFPNKREDVLHAFWGLEWNKAIFPRKNIRP